MCYTWREANCPPFFHANSFYSTYPTSTQERKGLSCVEVVIVANKNKQTKKSVNDIVLILLHQTPVSDAT